MSDIAIDEQRRSALRRWLKGRQFHAADIAATLVWWEQACLAGEHPTDDEVLKQCDSFERDAVDRYRQQLPAPQIVAQYQVKTAKQTFLWSALGAGFGGILSQEGAIRWLGSVTMQSLWLLKDYVVQLAHSLSG